MPPCFGPCLCKAQEWPQQRKEADVKPPGRQRRKFGVCHICRIFAISNKWRSGGDERNMRLCASNLGNFDWGQSGVIRKGICHIFTDLLEFEEDLCAYLFALLPTCQSTRTCKPNKANISAGRDGIRNIIIHQLQVPTSWHSLDYLLIKPLIAQTCIYMHLHS